MSISYEHKSIERIYIYISHLAINQIERNNISCPHLARIKYFILVI